MSVRPSLRTAGRLCSPEVLQQAVTQMWAILPLDFVQTCRMVKRLVPEDLGVHEDLRIDPETHVEPMLKLVGLSPVCQQHLSS